MRSRRAALSAALVVIVGCGSSVPPVTPEIEAIIAADAVTRACEDVCANLTLLVRDELIGTQTGSAGPMPFATQQAIRLRLSQVEFIDMDRADELVPNGVLEDQSVVLIYVGPIVQLDTDVLGIEVGVATNPNGFLGRTFQYLWTGDQWRPATSDDTGVTVVTSVS